MNNLRLVFMFLAMSFPFVHGETTSVSQSSKIAEHLYFTGINNRDLKSWTESLSLSDLRKRGTLAYLAGHSIERAPVPAMRGRFGTSVLTVGSKGREFTVDFSKLSERNLIVNGHILQINKNADFSEVAYKIGQVINPNASASRGILSILEPFADAAGEDDSSNFSGAVMYWSGIDQLNACMGQESVTGSNCVFRSDASMILADIRGAGEDSLREFVCEGDKFVSLSVHNRQVYGADWRLKMNYDGQDKLSQRDVFLGEKEPSCRYPIKDGKLANAASGAANCPAQSLSDYSVGGLPKKLKAGDTPKVVWGIPIPVQRLQSCCKSKACKEALSKAGVPVTSAPQSGAGAVQ